MMLITDHNDWITTACANTSSNLNLLFIVQIYWINNNIVARRRSINYFCYSFRTFLAEGLDGRLRRDGERMWTPEPEAAHKESEELESPWATIWHQKGVFGWSFTLTRRNRLPDRGANSVSSRIKAVLDIGGLNLGHTFDW